MEHSLSSLDSMLEYLDVECLKPRFQKHMITFEMLPTLKFDQWKELVPEIGARNKLGMVYHNASASQADTVVVSNVDDSNLSQGIDLDTEADKPQIPRPSDIQTSTQTSNISMDLPNKRARKNPRYFKSDESLKEFLERHALTTDIMHLFDFENGQLVKAQRQLIVRTIIDGLLERLNKVEQSMLNDIAYDLVAIFPNEPKELYFQFARKRHELSSVDGNISLNARGLLYDKLVNEKHSRKVIDKHTTENCPQT